MPLRRGWTGPGSGMIELGVGLELRAQARADRARAVGIVEREHPGRQLRQADPAVLTGVVLRKHRVAVFRDLI